jgi:hypothetical protein
MLRIDCKSPDRVSVLLEIDALAGEAVVEQSDRYSSYQIWCVGVEQAVLELRLSAVCQHPYVVTVADPPLIDRSGGPM